MRDPDREILVNTWKEGSPNKQRLLIPSAHESKVDFSSKGVEISLILSLLGQIGSAHQVEGGGEMTPNVSGIWFDVQGSEELLGSIVEHVERHETDAQVGTSPHIQRLVLQSMKVSVQCLNRNGVG